MQTPLEAGTSTRNRGRQPPGSAEDRGTHLEAKLAAILEHAPLAVFELDAERRVVAWNPWCETLTGLTADRVMGGALPIVGVFDRDSFETLFTATRQGNEAGERVHGWRMADGGTLRIRLRLVPIESAAGSVDRVLGLAWSAEPAEGVKRRDRGRRWP